MSLCGRISLTGEDRAAALFHCLEALYDFPPRAYHNLDHVASLLGVLDQFRFLAQSPNGVEFAVWLHDCIYSPGSNENESRSADVAEAFLLALQVDTAFSASIRDMILATRHVDTPVDRDAQLTADIDLSVLAVPQEQFRENGRRIRSEFAAFSDAAFEQGRQQFLKSFLAMPHIYHTVEFREHFEALARRNLQAECDAFSSNE